MKIRQRHIKENENWKYWDTPFTSELEYSVIAHNDLNQLFKWLEQNMHSDVGMYVRNGFATIYFSDEKDFDSFVTKWQKYKVHYQKEKPISASEYIVEFVRNMPAGRFREVAQWTHANIDEYCITRQNWPSFTDGEKDLTTLFEFTNDVDLMYFKLRCM